MNTLFKPDRRVSSMNTFFDDFFSKDLFDWSNKNFSDVGTTLPSVNIKETTEAFRVDLAAPGMKKEDFKIEIHNNVMTISAEKKNEKQEKDNEGNYTRREFSYESFSRAFALPLAILEDKIEAAYQDGILKLTIPKKEKTTPVAKKIEIK